jgi:CBS domain-containing protein
MIEAKDIMSTNLITVTEDTTADELIEILASKKITGLPVVDDQMHLVGLVSEKDILGIAYHTILCSFDGMAKKTAKDIMTNSLVSFRPNDSLADICQCFMMKDFRRVPVVDNGKLVGLISRKDIISASFSKKNKTQTAHLN